MPLVRVRRQAFAQVAGGLAQAERPDRQRGHTAGDGAANRRRSPAPGPPGRPATGHPGPPRRSGHRVRPATNGSSRRASRGTGRRLTHSCSPDPGRSRRPSRRRSRTARRHGWWLRSRPAGPSRRTATRTRRKRRRSGSCPTTAASPVRRKQPPHRKEAGRRPVGDERDRGPGRQHGGQVGAGLDPDGEIVGRGRHRAGPDRPRRSSGQAGRHRAVHGAGRGHSSSLKTSKGLVRRRVSRRKKAGAVTRMKTKPITPASAASAAMMKMPPICQCTTGTVHVV